MHRSRREFIRQTAGAVAIGATGLSARGDGQELRMQTHRCDWMIESRKFGLMVHWVAPGPQPEKGDRVTDLNQAVDAFDVDRFMDEFGTSGAAWLIFSIGQNTACYASPNDILDGLAGPGHCSERDLVMEIAERVHAAGKRFITYLPTEVNAPTALHDAFAWNPEDQSEFQRRYTNFIREYAVRYGDLLDGWWFDGCYTWDVFHSSLYDWPLWCDAARAGNPDAAVTFNDGSLLVGNTKPLTPLQDYLSGEVGEIIDGKIRLGQGDDAPLYLPDSRFVEGTSCQWHALAPIDCLWEHTAPGPMEPPRYTDENLAAFLDNCLSVQGAVTLNAGIYQEGHLGRDTLAQLGRLSRNLD